LFEQLFDPVCGMRVTSESLRRAELSPGATT